jgi:hypothetical protein
MEEKMIVMKLLGMIVLGLLSAALSYYKKNYYVRAFDDILGREEDDKAAVRVGRGFLYGFFFPVYFVLLLTALVALISFLILAGIIAAIIFVIVWVTEKILPHAWFGNLVGGLFQTLGLKGAASETPSDFPASADPASQGSTNDETKK